MNNPLLKILLPVLLVASLALAQAGLETSIAQPVLSSDAAQTAQILGLASPIKSLQALRAQRPCGSISSPEELSIRQDLLESIQASDLDIDAVLSEVANERDELADLRTSLQNRRDRTVGILNSAALITGSGIGIAASATQFTSLSSKTQNVGDGIGIGSGAASTILSLLAARKQSGPKTSVGHIPNMLAPLFGGAPVLHTDYPLSVLHYLQSVPSGENAKGRTRLDQLREDWVKAGRLNGSGSARQDQEVQALTTSMNPAVKVSINDLSNRIAMLEDVSGRVSLMKRDLANIVRSYARKPGDCAVPAHQQR